MAAMALVAAARVAASLGGILDTIVDASVRLLSMRRMSACCIGRAAFAFARAAGRKELPQRLDVAASTDTSSRVTCELLRIPIVDLPSHSPCKAESDLLTYVRMDW